MPIDTSVSPYFDDYDPKKEFTKVLGVAGRVSQVREFNQAQSIQNDFLSRLGNAVLRNGQVINGCIVTIDQESNQATISEGQVFLNGLVRDISEQIVDITGKGDESLGLKITEAIVTESDDESLYDNADGYKNKGNSGAHRIKEAVTWVVNDNASMIIYSLRDGQLLNTTKVDDTLAQVSDLLARRTFDENGSYKVRGLNILNRNEHDEDNAYVTVVEGKAYVQGYEVTKSASSRVGIRKTTDTRVQYNESKTFGNQLTYEFNNQPVKEVKKLSCIIRKNKKMTRGNISGGLDPIEDEREGSIVGIVKVSQGDTTYNQGADFVFQSNGIDWSPNGSEPDTGVQYDLTYDYNQVMLPTEYDIVHNDIRNQTFTYEIVRSSSSNTDSLLVPDGCTLINVNRVYQSDKTYSINEDWKATGTSPENYKLDWSSAQEKPENGTTYNVELVLQTSTVDETKDFLNITAVGENTPLVGSSFMMDYEFYLGRSDLIVIDTQGYCSVVEGIPDMMRKVYAPSNKDERVLPVGTVTIYPNSYDLDVYSYKNIRLDQGQLYNVRQRVDNLEYNVALDDLDKEAMEGETATLLRGIFTDGFIGVTKADVTHKEFDCSFDFDNGYLLLPQNEGVSGVTPNGQGNAETKGGIASAPFDEEVYISQPLATTEFLVNPYAVYDNLAIVELDPYVDNWVDSTKLTVDGGTSYKDEYVEVNGGTRYVDGGTTRKREVRGTIFPDYDVTTYRDERSTSYSDTSSTNTTTRTQTDMILDEAILYMRPIKVKVNGSNFTVNADNLTGYFNDMKVNLSPLDATSSGSNEGTVRSDSNGKFSAEFTIPEGVPCGNVEMRVENDYNHGGTNFSAQGRKQIIQDTVFKTVTTTHTRTKYDVVTRYTTITTIHDPLAQSFYIDEDTVLTKLGLFFSEKDSSKNIILEVRELDNGYPSATILMQQVVDSSSINVSEDAKTETEIVFDQPLYLEGGKSYCFVIVSDSNKYKMWTAQLGEIDEHSFEEAYHVVTNPYIEGVMFSSSNAQTWNAHQDTDLKFKLYRASFSESGIVMYSPVTVDQATAMVLAAQSADYNNQGVHWYYQLENSEDWLPIETFCYWNLNEEVSQVSLKCELQIDSKNTSPFLNIESVNLVYYNNESSGNYVSRQVVMDNPFDTIQVSIEAYTTGNTGFKMFYSLKDDDSEWVEMKNPDRAQVDQYFYRYTYTDSELPERTNKCRIKIELSTSNALETPVLRKLMVIMKNV